MPKKLKTVGGRHYLCSGEAEPVEITNGAAYKFVCDKVQKDFAGKRVSNKKLREYADKHGFYGGWVESAYDVIKPSRSIESIERDIEKMEERSYKRTLASHAFGGNLPGGGALDRDMQRLWEGKEILKAELERAKQQPKAAATPKRKKVPYFTIGKADRLIAKNFTSRSDKQLHTDIIKLRDYIRYIELGDREVLMRGGYFKQVAHPDASGLSPANIFLHQNLKYTLERAYAEKDTRQPPRTPAAKPAAKPAKKAAAPKPKSKPKTAAKPAKGKAKKPAPAGITLTAAQKKRLAAKGSITIKRGGKFVTVRG